MSESQDSPGRGVPANAELAERLARVEEKQDHVVEQVDHVADQIDESLEEVQEDVDDMKPEHQKLMTAYRAGKWLVGLAATSGFVAALLPP